MRYSVLALPSLPRRIRSSALHDGQVAPTTRACAVIFAEKRSFASQCSQLCSNVWSGWLAGGGLDGGGRRLFWAAAARRGDDSKETERFGRLAAALGGDGFAREASTSVGGEGFDAREENETMGTSMLLLMDEATPSGLRLSLAADLPRTSDWVRRSVDEAARERDKERLRGFEAGSEGMVSGIGTLLCWDVSHAIKLRRERSEPHHL